MTSTSDSPEYKDPTPDAIAMKVGYDADLDEFYVRTDVEGFDALRVGLLSLAVSQQYKPEARKESLDTYLVLMREHLRVKHPDNESVKDDEAWAANVLRIKAETFLELYPESLGLFLGMMLDKVGEAIVTDFLGERKN